MTLQERTHAHARWMIKRDLTAVAAIDGHGHGEPWGEEHLLRVLGQRNAIGMVVERGDAVAGFMVYEVHRDRLHLARVGVDPPSRNLGIFRSLSHKLQGKLSPSRRTTATSIVNERNMGLLLAMKACGWMAVEVVPGHFDDGDSDGIEMELKYAAATQPE